MKVLMLNYEYPPLGGGGAAVCRDMSELMIKDGDKVSVVTMAFKGLARKENYNGVEIHRVACWRSKKRVCHPWEQLTYCISAFHYIIKKMDIKQYDIVHCHFIIPTGLLALWLRKKYGIKFLVTAHGSDVLGHNNARFKYLYGIVKPMWKSILKNATMVTAPSYYLANKICKAYSNVDCQVVPNGIFNNLFGVGSRKKSIIVAARLQESKGIQDLIEACSKIDMSEWEVNILGEGPYRDELEILINKYNLQEIIYLRGYISGEEYVRYLSEASIYFTGSWFEAMPVSVLEAMASQNLIIASNIEPHRELLPEDCIYCSEEELIEKLKMNMKRTEFVKQYDIEKYEWNNIIQKYKQIYKQLV
ncbi:glycosyltransferase family 4 protein [Parablautia muri]|uniref:Glycosyltransferase family 1 protein n=1 Tax=Parablautia muri TaxID=2320879 RepID=A0A9X5BCS3_9FIRM|nr:glycosyltransferase family 4 protein [Parablautia muri]NBJ91353.1 glycosyltransferase family 1 protein [Parablautia muri]